MIENLITGRGVRNTNPGGPSTHLDGAQADGSLIGFFGAQFPRLTVEVQSHHAPCWNPQDAFFHHRAVEVHDITVFSKDGVHHIGARDDALTRPVAGVAVGDQGELHLLVKVSENRVFHVPWLA